MNTKDVNHRDLLKNIARRVMLERGLLPDFSREALAELEQLHAPADDKTVLDMKTLLWASIDNNDSRDLDQLTVAEALPSDKVKILVAIADVDSSVKTGSAIDDHARHNTTSVYTAAEIFPMLPEKISTDLTSLNSNQDRLSLVIEMIFKADGSLEDSRIYRAWVRNHAKLAYNSVAAWLENKGPIPEEVSAVKGLAENLQIQSTAAKKLKALRHANGALDFETIESRPVFDGDNIKGFEEEKRNDAKDVIEDFMIAANGVTARFLAAKKFPSIQRIVKTPKRWDRIVELATEHGHTLPAEPDSKALDEFLLSAKSSDPLRFPDLSLSVIKLLGAGEYVVELPGESSAGHFGLAVKEYSHSTAPNRRYPDLITQRLLKAAVADSPIPFTVDELQILAKHCTDNENAAKKVERQVKKSAVAMVLESKINQQFDSIVTGASAKGTWVRLEHPSAEGRVVQGYEGLDVGHRCRVQLLHTDVDRGFIDFKKVN